VSILLMLGPNRSYYPSRTSSIALNLTKRLYSILPFIINLTRYKALTHFPTDDSESSQSLISTAVAPFDSPFITRYLLQVSVAAMESHISDLQTKLLEADNYITAIVNQKIDVGRFNGSRTIPTLVLCPV
jgi:hypothetical protein